MESTIHDLMAQVRLTKRLLDDLHPAIIKLRASHDRLLTVCQDMLDQQFRDYESDERGIPDSGKRACAAIAQATGEQPGPDETFGLDAALARAADRDEPDGPEPDLMATDYREGLELGHPDAGR